MNDRNPASALRRASDAPIVNAPIAQREPAIETGLATDSVAILFQPVIDLAQGRVAGAEALARLPAIAGADLLFERARRAGLAERLSRHVQRKALGMAGAWDGTLAGLGVSLNLLPEDLVRPGYDVWLLAEMAAAGMAPQRVTVEITEQALIADTALVADRLAYLRASGIRVALDDFGTGYASMAYLAALPLDLIKIDRSLIAGIEHGNRERIVVRSILGLARDLGLAAVVEGVETAAQLDLLREWGCDLYQGFLGAPPMTAERLARFVAARG